MRLTCLRTRLPLRVPRHWQCSHEDAQHQPQRIKPSRTACAPINFPASKPTCSLTLAALDALRVDDDFRWAHLSLLINSDPIADGHASSPKFHQCASCEIGIHRLPSRKITGQRAPATTFTEHVKMLRMSPCSQNEDDHPVSGGIKWLEQFKLFWSQVARSYSSFHGAALYLLAAYSRELLQQS